MEENGKEMIESVLLIYVPSREGVGMGSLPLGLLYAGSALERLGIRVKIFDIYLSGLSVKDGSGYSHLKRVIDGFNPDIVGFGGIATSYVRTKELSLRIRREYPGVLQIAGGALSSVNELLLRRASVDVVFHGEAESNLPIFLERLRKKKPYIDVPGISFLHEGVVRQNRIPMPIKNLDDIPFPSYHLVEAEKYFTDKKEVIDAYEEEIRHQGLYESIEGRLRHVRHFFPIATSRGCVNRCSFCFRQMMGYRKHSVGYVVRHMKLLMEKFGINGFVFMDELFNGDVKWVMALCDEIEKNRLNIACRAGGRVDKVSEKMLLRLRDIGCFNFNYGQESGSNKILKEYKKGVSREQNIRSTLLARKCGILSIVQLVIGSPGETRETILDTVDFLKAVGVRNYSLNYLIPLPGAPIWNYVRENNLVDDVEGYLAKATKWEGITPFINLTKTPDREWKNWHNLIRYKLDLHLAKTEGNFGKCIRSAAKYYLKKHLSEGQRHFLKRALNRSL